MEQILLMFTKWYSVENILFMVNMLYFRYKFGELQYLTDQEC
jgi:hypothetical protein